VLITGNNPAAVNVNGESERVYAWLTENIGENLCKPNQSAL
jgi:hypothetical protein